MAALQQVSLQGAERCRSGKFIQPWRNGATSVLQDGPSAREATVVVHHPSDGVADGKNVTALLYRSTISNLRNLTRSLRMIDEMGIRKKAKSAFASFHAAT
jgi:hypothetical protein